jgi:hypothetical protein
MDADEFDLLRTLIEEVKTLRLEIQDKVDVSALERIDKVIEELESSTSSPVNFRNALILLGMIIEHLPSIVQAIDSLIQK